MNRFYSVKKRKIDLLVSRARGIIKRLKQLFSVLQHGGWIQVLKKKNKTFQLKFENFAFRSGLEACAFIMFLIKNVLRQWNLQLYCSLKNCHRFRCSRDSADVDFASCSFEKSKVMSFNLKKVFGQESHRLRWGKDFFRDILGKRDRTFTTKSDFWNVFVSFILHFLCNCLKIFKSFVWVLMQITSTFLVILHLTLHKITAKEKSKKLKDQRTGFISINPFGCCVIPSVTFKFFVEIHFAFIIL